jgi:hypothetical protein
MALLKSLLAKFLGSFLFAIFDSWRKEGVNDAFREFVYGVVELAEATWGEGKGKEKAAYAEARIIAQAKLLGKTLKKSTIDSLIVAAVKVLDQKTGQ